MDIRAASENDAELLTELAWRAKAHWGYSAEFMELCRDDLKVSAEFIRDGHVFVGTQDGAVVGFFGFSETESDRELVHLYVDPAHIGSGLGKKLWDNAVREAKALGWESFEIVSDPNAKTFYEKMGATLMGEMPSPVKKDRIIPWLKYFLR